MSYLVLARKYRPQTFEEVVEQKQVTLTLTNAIKAGRVAHAILFSGPRGTGKTTIARILAKAMNCEKGPTPRPCNVCRSCMEITAGAATDVFEIDGASNNSVDQVRELRENARFMPAHSPYKIYIIDEVHMLSKSAFNALLKTLEEPPPHVMFFFATTEPHKVPVTILSRCQRHDLSYISIDPIVGHLEMICGKEGVKIGKKSLELIARETGGSVRDALSLLDQVMSCSEGEISHDMVLQTLGVLDNDTLFQLSDSVLDRDIKRALEILDNVYRSGHDIKKFYSEVMAHLRNLLVIKVGAGDELSSSIPSSEVKRLEEQAARMSELFLTQALSLMMADEEKVRFSQHPRIVMEMVFVKLAKTARALPVDMLIKKIDELKNELSSMAPENFSVPEVEPGPLTDEQDTRDKTFHAPHSEGETGPADTGKPAMDVNRVVPGKPDDIPDDKVPKVMGVDRAADWEAILAIIGDKHPLLAANLNNSTLTAVKDNRLEIKVYGSKTNRAILQRKQSLDNLKKICSDFFKKEMEISITYNANDTIGTDATHGNTAATRRRPGPHPMVLEVLDIFGGKIINT